MKRYSIFHIPALAFFSKDLYSNVALHWKGTCLGYLLLLLIICLIPPMVSFRAGLIYFAEIEAPKIISQVPTITFIDGTASTDAPQPYYINDPDSGNVLAIIDTIGQITSLEGTEAIALLRKNDVLFKKSEIFKESKLEARTFDFAKITRFTLDQNVITNWLNIAKTFLVPIVFISALVVSYLFRIVQALIYAAVGTLFVSKCNAQIPYVSVLRLAVVAVTPCIIVKTIIHAAGLRFPLEGLLYLIITLCYLYFGVKAVSRLQQELPQADNGKQTLEPWRGT